MLSNPVELSVHRLNTKRFISADPTTIVLFKKNKQIVDGSERVLPPTARQPQKFKIIWGGDTGVLREPGIDGGARRFDFVLLGAHNAIIEIGDYWKVGEQEFRIEYIYPNNGYEVKAGGVSHGLKPTG